MGEGVSRAARPSRARPRFASPWLIQRPEPVDWFRILADLAFAGVCNNEAALRINVPRGTLRRWKYGSKPNHDDGQALLELHRQVCGGQMAQMRRSAITEGEIKRPD